MSVFTIVLSTFDKQERYVVDSNDIRGSLSLSNS